MRKNLEKLQRTAWELGFSAFGTTAATESAAAPHFRAWLAAGRHAGMGYLAKNADAFERPQAVLPGAKSLIMLGMTYENASRLAHERYPDAPIFALLTPPSAEVPTFEIAAFARTGIDYHVLIREQMKRLQAELTALFPGQTSRGVVDSAPLHEREYARRAGLGFLGRNRMLLRPDFGSTFFLSAILTSVEIGELGDFQEFSPEKIVEFEKRCDGCGKCFAACPTHALTETGLDANRCRSYLSIENRGEIPEQLRASMQNCLFGCDVCQRVCPWNEHLWNRLPDLGLPRERLESIGESEFRTIFDKTPFARPGWEGLRRFFSNGEEKIS